MKNSSNQIIISACLWNRSVCVGGGTLQPLPSHIAYAIQWEGKGGTSEDFLFF